VIPQIDRTSGPGSVPGVNPSTGDAGMKPAPEGERATIIRTGPGRYLARSASGVWSGKLRGRLRVEIEKALDSVCVGDEVILAKLEPGPAVVAGVEVSGTATMVSLLPRRTSLVRLSPPPRARAGAVRQVLAANVDLVVAVVAAVAPPLKINTINRYLLLARQAEIEGIVCINKTDQCLELPDQWERVQQVQAALEARSVRVFLTSAERKEGIDLLRRQLLGKTSVFVGPSGVGKTSILNRLHPALEAKTLAISTATGKGRHSTSFASLIDIGGGYVADLPGLRAIGFWNLEEETARAEFPELEALALGCRFSDCTHTGEPACAVLAAVYDGSLADSRYAEFLKVLREAKRSGVGSPVPGPGRSDQGHRAGPGSAGRRPLTGLRTRSGEWWEDDDNP